MFSKSGIANTLEKNQYVYAKTLVKHLFFLYNLFENQLENKKQILASLQIQNLIFDFKNCQDCFFCFF